MISDIEQVETETGRAEKLLSIKDAAAILNLDKKSIRERLLNGQLLGEKKLVGDREKWFVHSHSIESTLAKRRAAYPNQSDTSQSSHATANHNSNQSDSAVQILNVITATAFEADLESSLDQRTGLPIRQNASEILRGEWYQQEKARIEDFIEHAISEQVLQPLVDRLSAEAAKQISAATKAANDELEIERLKAKRLEERVFELHEEKVELEVSMHQELELLQLENTARETSVAEQLSALTQKLESLERPWWKKLFSK
ncbi:hypothetical protein KBI23_06185 [bacterium]|nr:hypothetical protein [bacterium]MBP9809513.1 hypothetical protein [bacterium]